MMGRSGVDMSSYTAKNQCKGKDVTRKMARHSDSLDISATIWRFTSSGTLAYVAYIAGGSRNL